MNISIFGLGYVGCVSCGCLADLGNNIIGVDISENKVNLINAGKSTVIESDIDDIVKKNVKCGRLIATHDYRYAVVKTDISFVAVGTPSDGNGHLDLSSIYNVIENIAESLKLKESFHVIVIRSTVMPGTSEKIVKICEKASGKVHGEDFAVLSNPEFLREASAVHDFHNPPFTLVGGNCEKAFNIVRKVYSEISSDFICTDWKTAELFKYVNNTFHALKVTFANEVGNISKSIGVDSHRLMEIFCKDKILNISPYYLKPGFAYGGSCLPKDLKALQTLSSDLYIETPVISSIDKSNNIQINNAIKLIEKAGEKKVALLGLSFKAGTDDLRNSPYVILAEALLGKGYEILIHDTCVNLTRLEGRNKQYTDMHIPHLTRLLNEDLDEVVNKSDLIVVCQKSKQYSDVLFDTQKPILDLARIDNAFLEKQNYQGICW